MFLLQLFFVCVSFIAGDAGKKKNKAENLAGVIGSLADCHLLQIGLY